MQTIKLVVFVLFLNLLCSMITTQTNDQTETATQGIINSTNQRLTDTAETNNKIGTGELQGSASGTFDVWQIINAPFVLGKILVLMSPAPGLTVLTQINAEGTISTFFAFFIGIVYLVIYGTTLLRVILLIRNHPSVR